MRRERRAQRPSVLLVDEHGGSVGALADRVRALGLRCIRAKTPDQALELMEDPRFAFGAALVSTSLAVPDWPAAIGALRARSRGEAPIFVAVGPAPDEAMRTALRRARVELGMWEPVGENALRFQINRAVGRVAPERLRAEERTSSEWPVRFWVQGRLKQASLYSFSAGGAFLATPRPSLRGCPLALELPLPSGSVTVAGEVVYTNVPGNLAKRELPHGMAVRFTDAEPADEDAIRRHVSERAALLRV